MRLTTFIRAAALTAALGAAPVAQAQPSSTADRIAAAVHSKLSLETLPLWAGKAPGALGDRPQDIPTLTVVAPDEDQRPNGTAVIVAPGGSYMTLSSGKEGRQVADWFAAHGVTAFVLTYRLVTAGYTHPTQLHDAQRAIRWVRANAATYHLDPARIGMIGFSAVGHLTAMAETQFDAGDRRASDPVERASSRPDFAILAYAPVGIWPRDPRALAVGGPSPSPAAVRALTPMLNVTPQTPPTFIFQTTPDPLASPLNATKFYDALYAAKVPVEAHIFADGPHGEGLGQRDSALSLWPLLLQNWLAGRGLLGPAGRQD